MFTFTCWMCNFYILNTIQKYYCEVRFIFELICVPALEVLNSGVGFCFFPPLWTILSLSLLSSISWELLLEKHREPLSSRLWPRRPIVVWQPASLGTSFIVGIAPWETWASPWAAGCLYASLTWWCITHLAVIEVLHPVS